MENMNLKNIFTFKNMLLLLWALSLLLVFLICRYKYVPFNMEDGVMFRIDRITGKMDYIVPTAS